MVHVTSEDVAAYSKLCANLARLNVGRAGAEFDDLYQEGMVAVFLCLRRGIHPSKEVIEGRQVDWVRYLHRLRRLEPTSYETLLPTELVEYDLHSEL